MPNEVDGDNTPQLQLISRDDAKALGLKRYFTGEPCSAGHTAERYISNQRCIPCNLAGSKATRDPVNKNSTRRVWVANNHDRHQAMVRKWRRTKKARETALAWEAANRTKRRQQALAVYAARIELIRERDRLRYAAAPAAKRAGALRWAAENPVKARERGDRYRARKNGAEGTHSAAEAGRLLQAQRFRCAACTKSIRKKEARHKDHIVALVNGGSDWIENIQWLCVSCNCSKGSLDQDEWMRRRGSLKCG